MKKILMIATFAILGGLANTADAAPAPIPAPKIVVVNRAAILQYSRVGQDIKRQMDAFAAQARGEFDGRAKSIEAEGRSLQQQIAILAPDVKAKRIQAYQTKQTALQADVQKREAMMNGGLLQARGVVEKALGPILQQILQQRGANMVIDQQAVVMASNNAFDVTPDAINLLNQKLPSVKVTLTAPPAQAAPGK